MVSPPDRLTLVAAEFRVASERLFTNAPGYQCLAAFIAEEPELVALAAQARAEQPAVLMLLGAVRYLLLRGLEDPLSADYAALQAGDPVDLPGMCTRFAALCRRNQSQIVPLLQAGRVQTNEVGRSVYLRLGIEWLGATFGEATLWYVEIGASAGLNLAWESFSMQVERPEAGVVVQRGPPDSPVRLSTQLSGAACPTEQGAALPLLRGHRGLEIHPPDLSRAEDRDWLLAFVWVDHGDRFARTRHAIELATQTRRPLLAADVTTGLIPATADIPAADPICVAHTFLLSQLPPEALERLHSQLGALSLHRAVYLVGVEWEEGAGTFLQVTRWSSGRPADVVRLAEGDAHGRRVRWL